jgi:hypothetical protein
LQKVPLAFPILALNPAFESLPARRTTMNRKTTGILTTLIAAAMIAGCSGDNSPVQPQPSGPQATVITATGDITAKAGEFRTLLGDPANGGSAGQQPAGRREVNWDGAGARPFNNQNNFPAAFFNTNVRAGLVLSTIGTGLRNDSLLFAEVNPAYANEFKTFSPKVMFSAVGSNQITALFQVAGAVTPAVVSGFGVVLSDVDLDNTTSIEPYDKNGNSLGRYYAPRRSDANGLSFVGVKYDAVVVARVKITCGNGAIGAGVNDISAGGAYDLVVVDNFIFGEPNAF